VAWWRAEWVKLGLASPFDAKATGKTTEDKDGSVGDAHGGGTIPGWGDLGRQLSEPSGNEEQMRARSDCGANSAHTRHSARWVGHVYPFSIIHRIVQIFKPNQNCKI
jgi:hypothetical protein